MAAVQRKLKKGELLFREGDPSDSAYVVKSGHIAITKAKGNKEIELAALGPGQMFGEMAFFDNKPRSAGARAKDDCEVIALPFDALNAQFKTFPQWLKAMVKTINDNLRDANKRIKNLEKATGEDEKPFTPYTVNKFIGLLSFVAHRYGEPSPEDSSHIIVPTGLLRNFTIQIFQEPTNKMQKMIKILECLGLLALEDLGEGKQRLTIKKLDQMFSFVEFYNKWLFTEESKRITIERKDLKVLRALKHYGSKAPANENGRVKVSLTEIQNESMKDLSYVVSINDWESLIEKGVTSDKISEKDGVYIEFKLDEAIELLTQWEMVYSIDDQNHV